MKTRQYIITLLAGASALAFAACSPNNERETPPATSANDAMDAAGDAAQRTANRVGESIENTWADIKDATYDERADFQASLNRLTTSVDQKINEVQARSASATEATKEKLNEGLEELREARADLQEEIADLRDATSDNWSEAKAEVANAWERVHQAYAKLDS